MMMAVAFGLVLLSVVMAGGSLKKIGDIPWRWAPAVVIGLLIQVIIISIIPEGSETLREVIHVGTYVLVGAFVVANIRVPGIAVIAVGALMNFVAIVANGGVMPARPEAVRAAGLEDHKEGEFMNSRPVEDPKLWFLGDVFAIPKSWPAHNVFSVGDVLIVLGAAYGLHRVCGSRLVPRKSRVDRNAGAPSP